MMQYPRHFIDIETTSLTPSRGEIIEICIITQTAPGFVSEFFTKIQPERIEDADPKSLEINGYTEEKWLGSPLFCEVAEQISHIICRGVIIGHGVEFDHAFLKKSFQDDGRSLRISHRRFDTISLAFEHLPIPWQSMKSIRRFFGWTTQGAHTARKDAKDCLMLFKMLFCCPWYKRLFYRVLWWKTNRKRR